MSKHNLSKFVGFCVDARLDDLIKTDAKLRGMTVSRFLREVLESHFRLQEQAVMEANGVKKNNE